VELLLPFGPGSERARLFSEWHRAIPVSGMVGFQGFVICVPIVVVAADAAGAGDTATAAWRGAYWGGSQDSLGGIDDVPS